MLLLAAEELENTDAKSSPKMTPDLTEYEDIRVKAVIKEGYVYLCTETSTPEPTKIAYKPRIFTEQIAGNFQTCDSK